MTETFARGTASLLQSALGQGQREHAVLVNQSAKPRQTLDRAAPRSIDLRIAPSLHEEYRPAVQRVQLQGQAIAPGTSQLTQHSLEIVPAPTAVRLKLALFPQMLFIVGQEYGRMNERLCRQPAFGIHERAVQKYM